MGPGWIKIYRSMKDHWVWQNDSYFKAWCIILMEVNFKKEKVLLKGSLVDCGRGEKLYSLNTWTEKFGKNWTLQKTRTFFKLLQDDKMICCSNIKKTTKLSVVNYDRYQTEQHTTNKQVTDKQHITNNNIRSKEGKEGRKGEELNTSCSDPSNEESKPETNPLYILKKNRKYYNVNELAKEIIKDDFIIEKSLMLNNNGTAENYYTIYEQYFKKINDSHIDEWLSKYDQIVLNDLKIIKDAILDWVFKNPQKRKTDVYSFITKWISRENQKRLKRGA